MSQVTTPFPSDRVRRAPRRLAVGLAAALAAGVFALAPGAQPAGADEPVTNVTLAGSASALDVVTVPGGAIWVARGADVVRFVPGSTPETITLPDGLNARTLAVATDGTVWFGGYNGSLGSISSNGTVTARPLADPTTWVASITVGQDGALWVLGWVSGVSHLERGAPGAAMTAVPTPDLARYSAVAAGGSGAVVLAGYDTATVTAAGTVTPLTGGVSGNVSDIATLGDEVWITTTVSGIEVVDASDHLTTYPAAAVVGSTNTSSITSGPKAKGWYLGEAPNGQGAALGRIGATGPDAATLVTDTPAATGAAVAAFLVPDPSADRLWAVGGYGQVTLRPIDLSKQLSTVTVDDPATDLAYGVTTSLTAHVTPFAPGTAATGTLTFRNHDGSTLGTAPAQPDGSATVTFPAPARATGLKAYVTYSGDETHRAELGVTVPWRDIAKAPTTIVLTAPAKARPGNNTFKVRVTSPSTVAPSGSIKIGNLVPIPVAGGVDTSFTVFLNVGVTNLSASFEPDDGFQASYGALPSVRASWDTDEENYVAAAYQRLFGRNADSGGRTYWANKIHNGLSRDQFALTQVTTGEYRRTVAKRVGLISGGATPTQAKPTVDAMAKKTVRELLVDKWADAKSVTSCVDTVAPQFAAKGSYMCWVKTISYTYKGSATVDDYTWASTYGNSPEGRRKVAKILVYSDTAVRPLVERAYSDYLGRSPDPGGWTYWTKKIQGGMREEGVEARVLGSDEFYRRTLVPPA